MEENIDQKFVFVLGREREIALAELKAVLDRFDFSYQILFEAKAENSSDKSQADLSFHSKNNSDTFSLPGNLAVLNIKNADESKIKGLIDVLAGTIKVFRLISYSHSEVAAATEESRRQPHASRSAGSRSFAYTQDDNKNKNLKKKIAAVILQERVEHSGKLDFGISSFTKSWSADRVNKIGIEIKRELKIAGVSSRFVALREGLELTSIQSLKNNLDDKGVEIGIFDDEIGVLIALNDPEEWNKRDYDKPAGDKYSGMVPPKLARMMINLALGQVSKSAEGSSKNAYSLTSLSAYPLDCVVIDPFCGSGNILMEAMMLGCDVVGSDISEKAVGDTKSNLEWLQNRFSDVKELKQDIFCANATDDNFIKNLKLRIKNCDHAVIVTEPYLGEPKRFKPSLNSARGEYSKIKNLYLSFLRNLSNLEVPICLVFPLIETIEGKKYSLFSESVDEINELGYTQMRQPLIYGREYQVVKREIVFLRNF